jgi:sn-glycerol 3-phosphate transport system ATP-binding protein
MRQGWVEQDAAPADLYARPATEFAARFVGTPPMNLLRMAGSPGHLVGVRPEDVRLAEDGLPARVTGVEYLGADSIVTCAAGADTLAVRLAGRVELAEGKIVNLTWAPAAQHRFDRETGRRIP